MEEDPNPTKDVMGTPDKTKNNQCSTSVRKFEDSPVFNFMINNLSPIKPIQPMHITQTINPLTLASLQSVFTSPHATSLNGSRVIHRHQLSDISRSEFSSDWNTANRNKANAYADNKLVDGLEGNLDPTVPPTRELSNEECSEIIAEFSRNNPEHEPEYGTNSYQNSEGNMEGVGIDQRKGTTSLCDWDDLVSNSSNLSVDPAMSFYTSIKHAIQNNEFTNPREESKMVSNEKLGINGGSSITNPCETMDYQHLSGLYRGVRKRCLVFDKAGVKHLADNSTSNSRVQENNSSQCILPSGNGLHLNAPSDYNIANKDSSFSRRSLIELGSFASLHHPPASSSQELRCTALTESKTDRAENEGVHPSSPKKKKQRLEQAGEGEGSCKRCNCKKSKCLKLYCECFAAGVYCVEPCACIDCFNKAVHEEIVLSSRKQIESRNPLAFAPKVIKGSESSSEVVDDISKTPGSARHKRGCNCKKSGCLKKYCECYQGGVGCSVNCRCEGCKNAFGTKDGSCALSVDHEFEEDEISTTEKLQLRKTTIQNSLNQTMGSALTATPLRQVTDQSFYFHPTPKFSSLPENMGEGKMPEFLLEGSPNSSNQQLPSSSSPNRKRVLPPQRSPDAKRSRKLILQSVPSYPGLMHKHHNP